MNPDHFENLPNDEKISQSSTELLDDLLEELKKRHDGYSSLPTLLYDLKYGTIKKAAELIHLPADLPVVMRLAELMPGYDGSSFYRTRHSLISLALAVMVGWLLGGFLSTLLDFFTLGGEILRPATIFAFIWLEDFLSSDPEARRILLSILGLGGLARLGASLASGLVSLANFASIRNLIFGQGARAGLFKSMWLWLGAIFLIAFFARKTTGLDLARIKLSLPGQIRERLALAIFILSSFQESEDRIRRLENLESVEKDVSEMRKYRKLALSILPMLDSLPADARDYLSKQLKEAGLEENKPDLDIFIWKEERDRPLYSPIGYVKEGDTCKILRRPVTINGELKKGQAQRLPQAAL